MEVLVTDQKSVLILIEHSGFFGRSKVVSFWDRNKIDKPNRVFP